MALRPLPTLAQMSARRRAEPKPSRALRHETTKRKKDRREQEVRDAVWFRDGGKSRATSKPLSRTAVDRDRKWDPHHLEKQSTHPEREFDVSNIVSLSRQEHDLAETVCPKNPKYFLLDILGMDASRALTFIRRDAEGRELWRRVTLPERSANVFKSRKRERPT